MRCLRGFYSGIENADRLKGEFLDQLNQCWLYCPDEVKEKAMGEFIAAIRKDLLSRVLVRCTKLIGEDFRHLKVNK